MDDLTIIGGGIGGLALASLLAHRGGQVRVLEAAAEPSPDTGGAFLNLAPNGVAALATIGPADEVAHVGWPSSRIEFRDHRDRRIATEEARDEVSRFGHQNTMVRRADLHRVLLATARDHGAEVLHGHGVEQVEEHRGGVILHAADRDLHAAAVIGADGVHSRARAAIAPEVEPAYLGLVDIGGFAPAVEGLPVGQQTMWFGLEAFFGAYVTPDGDAWWFCNLPRPTRPSRRELATTTPAAWLERVSASHASDPTVIGELLRRAPDPVGAWASTDLPPLPRWHTDRVCLMGDAAHATSPSAGQGASLALEDALVLARCLLGHDVAADAFAAFERRRRSRVEHLATVARRNSSTKSAGRVGRLVRNTMLPLFLRLGARDVSRAHGWTPPALPPATTPHS